MITDNIEVTSVAHVQTVLGPVQPGEIGRVLHHEHLLSLTPGPWLAGGRAWHHSSRSCGDLSDKENAKDQVQRAVEALSGLASLGIDTVVDLSPYGVVGRHDDGANVTLLQEISRRSGVHVVSGTAVYLEPFSPEWTLTASLDEITERFIADATTGIGSTSVRAGVLGEQATGLDVITAHEEKCLRAAARAHRATGLSLVTHTTHGTMAHEQVAILREEAADLNRIVIGHLDTHPDTGYVREVLQTGVNIAFDTVGKQFWDFRITPMPNHPPEGEFSKQAYHRADHTRARRAAELVAEGYEDQILLSQDLTGSEVYLNPTTHGQWGYSYLGAPFAALLRRHGVTSMQLEMMLHTNPLRLLTIGSPA